MDGYKNFSSSGCSLCNCYMNGSLSEVCNKSSHQCPCKVSTLASVLESFSSWCLSLNTENKARKYTSLSYSVCCHQSHLNPWVEPVPWCRLYCLRGVSAVSVSCAFLLTLMSVQVHVVGGNCCPWTVHHMPFSMSTSVTSLIVLCMQDVHVSEPLLMVAFRVRTSSLKVHFLHLVMAPATQ